jgi:hypothetical protein
MAARALVQCRIHGGYHRPGWAVGDVVMERIAEGAIVDLPAPEVDRLVATFGPSAWHRLPVPGEVSPTLATTRDVAALSVRDLLPAIRAGDFDDALDVLQQDTRATVAKTANARARTIARG